MCDGCLYTRVRCSYEGRPPASVHVSVIAQKIGSIYLCAVGETYNLRCGCAGATVGRCPCSCSPIIIAVSVSTSVSASGCLHPLPVPASTATEEDAWGADHEADDRYDRPEDPGSGKEAARV